MNKGFTIIELIISLAIFAMITGLLLAKYGTFNQGVILTNLAYDVALTIRTAQSYGLNVKSASRTTDKFDDPYGVYFNTDKDKEFIFFVDSDGFEGYSSNDTKLSTTLIKRGSKISRLCTGSCNNTENVDKLSILFKRPEPNAIIVGNGNLSNYAEITLQAVDGTTKKVIVRSTGQIEVVN